MAKRIGLVLTVALWPVLAIAAPSSAAERAVMPKGDLAQYFGPDEYPPEAIRQRQQGRTVAGLWIDDSGKVVSCTVGTSSGSDALDQATCRIALAKLQFTPALDRRGRPVAGRYSLPVRWVLPSGPIDVKDIRADETATITLSVDEAGVVVACQSTLTPPILQTTPCDGFPVGKATEFKWMRDGKPVGGTVTRTIHTVTTPDP